jgi:hypothetical protein
VTASPTSLAKSALETAKKVFEIEAGAIAGLIERLDARFEAAAGLLFACKGVKRKR